MQYRIDPKSGTELSALGFGCMRFPGNAEKTAALLQSAVERGVNYFDTAYIYGGSELTLGEVFRKHPDMRAKINLATKLPWYMVKTTDDFEKFFSTSMERMGVDYIDYYLIHNLTSPSDWQAMCALGIEDWIAARKADGKIKRLGFSYHGNQGDFQTLLEMHSWDFTQIQYNYSNENYQAGRAGLQRAAAMGLPVIVMEPLLGGTLATGLPKKAAALLEQAAPGRSAAAWALRWLWDQPEVTVVLSGMNAMEQLDENIEIAETAPPGCLSQAERDTYPKLEAAFREAYKISCTGCNYCMPCPRKVNIPNCFAAYNASCALGLFMGFQQYTTSSNVSLDAAQGGSARCCTQCGACVKKCPQHIAIPEQLKRVARRLEPAPMRWAARLHTKMHGIKYLDRFAKM